MKQTFGEFLSSQRKACGLTQKELATMLFVSESTVGKWEQNRANPDITVLPMLSEILGVSEHELITAGIDTVQRENNRKARKWTHLSFGWHLSFAIAYGTAILTCLIVDLAVGDGLSWFWIVLASCLLSASFTNLPGFVRRARLLTITLSELGVLILLLGVCCIYTDGDWFFVAAVPCIVAFLMIFLPIYARVYAVPQWIKRHSALWSLATDTAALICMFFVIECFTSTHSYAPSGWTVDVAIPILLSCAAMTAVIIAVMRYLPISRWFKTAGVLAVFGVSLPLIYGLIGVIVHRVFGEPSPIFEPHLLIWNLQTVSSNVQLLIILTIWTAAVIFAGIGLMAQKRKKRAHVES